MAVKPLEDRVLVKPIERENVTESGIFLPESSKEKPIQGTVVAVGPGKRLEIALDPDAAFALEVDGRSIPQPE